MSPAESDQRSPSTISFKGSCYCGSISYTVQGPPIRSAYCHCTLCQRLSCAPFICTIHFPASAFTWTHPTPQKAAYEVYAVADKPWEHRFRCRNCGACVTTCTTTKDKYSVWAGQLEREVVDAEKGEGEDGRVKIKNWDVIKPTAHMFYGTRLLDIDDGLPKWDGYEGESKRIG